MCSVLKCPLDVGGHYKSGQRPKRKKGVFRSTRLSDESARKIQRTERQMRKSSGDKRNATPEMEGIHIIVRE